MHPVERLRSLARAGPLEHRVLVRESAMALGALGDDPAGLVLSCRRLLQHQPTSGPLRWLCARVLCNDDARGEAWRCVEELEDDPTADRLGEHLPEDATVVVLGSPEVTGQGLARRGDARVLVVDALGEGTRLARRLWAVGVEAVEVDEGGTGAAVAGSDLLVLEAAAAGPDAFMAIRGSYAAAAVARHAGVPVWVVAGVGRVLPASSWSSLVAGIGDDEPWTADVESVPLDLADVVLRPSGLLTPAELLAGAPDCPDAPELLW